MANETKSWLPVSVRGWQLAADDYADEFGSAPPEGEPTGVREFLARRAAEPTTPLPNPLFFELLSTSVILRLSRGMQPIVRGDDLQYGLSVDRRRTHRAIQAGLEMAFDSACDAAAATGSDPQLIDQFLNYLPPELRADFGDETFAALIRIHSSRYGLTPQAYHDAFPARADRIEDCLANVSLGGRLSGALEVGDAADLVGTEFNGYIVKERLGRGGMGVVYKAWNRVVDRFEALKFLSAVDDQDLHRFRVEARSMAQCNDPHIVTLYGVGEHQGKPYIAMEICEGGSLDRRIGTSLPSAKEAAQLAQTLARTLQLAHSADVVHRDLKPANILLSGGQQADLKDCQAKISDFGLARRVDVDDRLTMTGQIFGTPAYMAPEQAVGSLANVGPKSDIYSLGAILYELLTGRPPFTGTLLDTLAQVRNQDPVAPRKVQRTVPRDLETICLKCLQKEPGQRYATAAGLADDLGRFLNHEPIQARRASWPERLWKKAKRNRWATAAIAAGAAALLATIWVESAAYQHRQQLRQEAQEQIDELLQKASVKQGAQQYKLAADDIGAAERLLERAGFTYEPRVADARATVRALLRDQEMVVRLERIQTSMAIKGSSEEGGQKINEGFDVANKPAEYNAAFKQYGIDLTASPAEAGEKVHESHIHTELSAALADVAWLISRSPYKGPLKAEKLLAIVKAGEPDSPAVQKFADAIRSHDSDTYLELARSPRLTELPSNYLLTLSEMLTECHQEDTGIRLLQAAVQKHPNDFWLLYSLAALQGRNENTWQACESTLNTAIALRPDSPGAYNGLCYIYLRRGKFKDAELAAKKSLELAPYFAEAHQNLALVYNSSDRPNDALVECKRALELNPAMLQANALLAVLQTKLLFNGGKSDTERLKASLPTANSTASKSSQDVQTDAPAGYIDQWTAVRDRFSAQRRLSPYDPSVIQRLADAHMNLGEYRSAEDLFRVLISFHPREAEPYVGLAITLNYVGRPDESVDVMQYLLKVAPNHPVFLYVFGEAQFRNGNLDKSISALKAAKTNAPKGEMDDRVSLYLGRSETIRKLGDKLLSSPPSSADQSLNKLLYLGWQKEYAEAVASYDQYAPNNQDWQMSQFTAAKFALRAAAGKGDAANATEAQRITWRKLALKWLRITLEYAKQGLAGQTEIGASGAVQMLGDIRWDTDLKDIRTIGSLKDVSDAERAEWGTFWKDVASARSFADDNLPGW